jgi:endonuclease YncB( thermonuclease family)
LAVAQVSDADGSKGRATAISQGSVRIIATVSDLTGSLDLTVTAKVLTLLSIVPSGPQIKVGDRLPLSAVASYSDGSTADVTNQANWASADGAIAAVSYQDAAGAMITGLAAGSTSVSARLAGIDASTAVSVR